MENGTVKFIHAPDNGYSLFAYGMEVTIWEDGNISVKTRNVELNKKLKGKTAPPMPAGTLRQTEVAKLLGVSDATICIHAKTYGLGKKVNNKKLYSASDIRELKKHVGKPSSGRGGGRKKPAGPLPKPKPKTYSRKFTPAEWTKVYDYLKSVRLIRKTPADIQERHPDMPLDTIEAICKDLKEKKLVNERDGAYYAESF